MFSDDERVYQIYSFSYLVSFEISTVSPKTAFQRIEIAADRERQRAIVPAYEIRDKKLNLIEGFWLHALQHNAMVASLVQLENDTKALKFLKTIRAWRNPEQVEAFGYEFVSTSCF